MTTLDKRLTQVLIRAIDQALKEMHVGLPAKVVSFDPSKRTIVAQPLLKRAKRVPGGGIEIESYPQIPSVPVFYPGGGGWSMRWDIQPGDTVYLSFCDRALDTWKDAQEGTEVDPSEPRVHSLKDAIAIPGLRPPKSSQPSVSPNTFIVGNENGSVEIVLETNRLTVRAPNVDISAGGDADEFVPKGNTLLQKLQDLDLKLASHTHPHPQGQTLTSPDLASPTFDASILSQTTRIK